MKNHHRPKPCWCSGYWFPHRTGSGACIHNPNVMAAAKLICLRLGLAQDETMDVMAGAAFDDPGIVSSECPF
jgi:hypothetical protein